MTERFEFTPTDFEDRFVHHFKLAREYAIGFGSEFAVDVRISKRRLYLTVISAYEDIARYKNYHLDDPTTQKSDAVKRAAYLTKWICRFKPLYVDEGDIVDLLRTDIDKTVIINELFALHLAAAHLSPDVGRDFVLTPQKGYEIAYEMMFRHLSEDSYLLVFQMIKDHIKNGTDIVQLF